MVIPETCVCFPFTSSQIYEIDVYPYQADCPNQGEHVHFAGCFASGIHDGCKNTMNCERRMPFSYLNSFTLIRVIRIT